MPSPASTKRNVTCDFYRVNFVNRQDLTFVQAMEQIHQMHPTTSTRNMNTDEGYIRVHNWSVHGKNADGVLLRLRANHSATVARIDQDDLRDLNLGPGEVLAEYFCFQYYDEYKTLVVHRNQDAGGYKRLGTYLEHMMPECRPVQLDTVMSEEAWRKLSQMHRMTVAEVTIAKPTSLDVFDTGSMSVTQMAHLAQDAGAETLTLRWSIGHTKNKLSNAIRDIMKIVTDLGVAQQAKVTGQISRQIGNSGMFKDELTEVDLITDRLRAKVQIDVSGGRAQTADFMRALNEAYQRHRPDLKKQFDQSSSAP